MNTYTIQSTELPSGILTARLITEIGGLTIPADPTLVFDSDLISRLDGIPGIIEPQSWKIRFMEDYSTYAEGFWFKVLMVGDPAIEVLLNEGTGNKYIFRGHCLREAISFGEFDFFGNIQRGGSFQCKSEIDKINNLTVQSLFNYLDTIRIDTFLFYNRLIDFVIAAANLGYEQTGVSIVQTGNLNEIIGKDESFGQYFSFGEFCMWANETTYSQTGLRSHWISTYTGTLDLIRDIAGNFGLLIDSAFAPDGKPTIRIFGRSGSVATLEMPIESSIGFDNALVTRITAGDSRSGSSAWIEPVGSRGGSSGGTRSEILYNYHLTTFPQNKRSDLSIKTLFAKWHYPQTFPDARWTIFTQVPGNDVLRVTAMKFYDYANATYSADIATDNDPSILADGKVIIAEPILGYLYRRFFNDKRMYERTYATLKATIGGNVSTTNMELGVKTQINDGISTRTYYATEIRKNFMTNRMFVKWIET